MNVTTEQLIENRHDINSRNLKPSFFIFNKIIQTAYIFNLHYISISASSIWVVLHCFGAYDWSHCLVLPSRTERADISILYRLVHGIEPTIIPHDIGISPCSISLVIGGMHCLPPISCTSQKVILIRAESPTRLIACTRKHCFNNKNEEEEKKAQKFAKYEK